MYKKVIILSLVCFLLFLSGFLMISCRKNKNQIAIRGTVYDPNTAINVEGALVVLSASKVSSGVYSSGYSEMGRTTTAADGTFSFDFNEEKVSGYRFYFSKYGYFQYYQDVSANDISPENTYSPTISLYPIGYLKVNVTNVVPFDTADNIIWSFTSGYTSCSDCCDDTDHRGHGMTVDESFKCKTYGNQNVNISWEVKKNGILTQHGGSVYCKASDTVQFHIFY